MKFFNILIIVLTVILIILIIYLIIKKIKNKQKSNSSNYNPNIIPIDIITPNPKTTSSPIPITPDLKDNLNKFLEKFTNKFQFTLLKNMNDILTTDKSSLKLFFNVFCAGLKGSLGNIYSNLLTFWLSSQYTQTPDIMIKEFKNADAINFDLDPDNNDIEYTCGEDGLSYITLNLLMNTIAKDKSKCLQVGITMQTFYFVHMVTPEDTYDIAFNGIPVKLRIEVLKNSNNNFMSVNLNNYSFDKKKFTFNNNLRIYEIFISYFWKYKFKYSIFNDALYIFISKFPKGEKLLKVLTDLYEGSFPTYLPVVPAEGQRAAKNFIDELFSPQFIPTGSALISAGTYLVNNLSVYTANFINFLRESCNRPMRESDLESYYTASESLSNLEEIINPISPQLKKNDKKLTAADTYCNFTSATSFQRMMYCFLTRDNTSIIVNMFNYLRDSANIANFGGRLAYLGGSGLSVTLIQWVFFTLFLFITIMYYIGKFLDNTDKNSLDCSNLHVNDILNIPINPSIKYSVKKGDDCKSICDKFKITIDQLIYANINISNIHDTEFSCTLCTYNNLCPITYNPANDIPCCICPPTPPPNTSTPVVNKENNIKLNSLENDICIPNCSNKKNCGDDDGCGGHCDNKYINKIYDNQVIWNIANYDLTTDKMTIKGSYTLDENSISNDIKVLNSIDNDPTKNIEFIYTEETDYIYINNGYDSILKNGFYYDNFMHLYRNIQNLSMVIYPTNCGDKCFTFNNDKNNCGSCGNKCDGCKECCNGVCLDLTNDNSNCGKCGNSCNEKSVCCDGICKQNFKDCNGTCIDGWSGSNCDISPTCNNHGVVTAGDCVCTQPWQGGECNICPPQYKDCITKNDYNAYVCNDSFAGKNCEKDRSYCNSHGIPVYNYDTNVFGCKCDNKYGGLLCDDQEL